jgi:hypothetical protein
MPEIKATINQIIRAEMKSVFEKKNVFLFDHFFVLR